MGAPLSDCLIDEQRTVESFLSAEGVKPAEMHCRMLAHYGAHAIDRRKVYALMKHFKARKASVKDER